MRNFSVDSGKLVISDPGWALGAWCQGIINAKNGIWDANIDIEGSTGNLKSLYAWNINAAMTDPSITQRIFNAPALPYVLMRMGMPIGFVDSSHYTDTLKQSIEELVPQNELWFATSYAVFGIPQGNTFTAYGLKDAQGDYVAVMIRFIPEPLTKSRGDDNDPDDDESEDEDI